MAEASDIPHDTIDALMAENRKFPPSEAFKADALVVGTYLYDEAAQNDEAFWAAQAADLLDWVEPWHTTLDWNLPDDEAVTVAGLVIHEAQTIPEPGQIFIFYRHRFQVLRRNRNQITLLSVSQPLLPLEPEAT